MTENDVENAPETCIVLPAFPPWGSQPEAKVAPASSLEVQTADEKQYWRVTDNYDAAGKPAGALGAVPTKKNIVDDAQQVIEDVCARAKAGHYLEIARANPTPDQYDEKGILIPPGCIGRVAVKKDRLPPEVRRKLESGAYLEMARYQSSLEEKANAR